MPVVDDITPYSVLNQTLILNGGQVLTNYNGSDVSRMNGFW